MEQLAEKSAILSFEDLLAELRLLLKRIASAKGYRSGGRKAQEGGERMPIKLEVPDESPIRPGSYRAQISEVAEGPSRYDPERTVIYIDFELLGGKFAGRRVRKFYSPTLSSRSKLGTLVRRLAGGELRPGQSFDLETLRGREVEVLLTQEETEDGGSVTLVADVFAVGEESSEKGPEETPF